MGTDKIPLKKPVLFLSNHQNALLDVLLIGSRCRRKPWFIARSDVFKGAFFKSLFRFLQMLPIYRIRDGKTNLHKNQAIFDQCGQLLVAQEAILLFPEANHSLKRRVRPLSKGFTRIIVNALEKNPNLDLQLVPIGQNYIHPRQVGDSATLYFGTPIAVQEFANSENFVTEIKKKVFEGLKQLTIHIPEEEYESVIEKLGHAEELFLNPEHVNSMIGNDIYPDKTRPKRSLLRRVFKTLFHLWNLPFVFLWRTLLKSKVPEPEFEATFRFGFVLLVYPLFYAIFMLVLWKTFNAKTACLVVMGHAVVNVLLVKMGITSSDRRK